jgi:hypothetical protein
MKRPAVNAFKLLSLIFSLPVISVYAQSRTLISKMKIPSLLLTFSLAS